MQQARQKGHVTLKHSFRQGNAVAHVLARKVLMQSNINKLCLFATPSQPAMEQYQRDLEGFSCVKFTSTHVCTRLAALGNDDAIEGSSSYVGANCSSLVCNMSKLDN